MGPSSPRVPRQERVLETRQRERKTKVSRRKEHRDKGKKKTRATHPPETEAQETSPQDPPPADSQDALESAPSPGADPATEGEPEAPEATNRAEAPEPQPSPREQELLDSLARAMADFDNFRKRVRREQAQADHETRSQLVSRLLPILDDYDRARGAAGPTEHPTDREVLLRILGGLADVLEREGLTSIQVEPGDSFDPSIHEAIGTTYSQGVPAQHIVEVFERGYFFRERLLRPARVLVSLGVGETSSESEGNSDGSGEPGDKKNHESDRPDPDE
jgi:molecular chaperone GrpE